jgi:hypothetical protein
VRHWDDIYWGKDEPAKVSDHTPAPAVDLNHTVTERRVTVDANGFATGGFITGPGFFQPSGCVILPGPGDYGNVTGMARTEVVEFTHHTKRDSEAIAEIWWNANSDVLTVSFVRGGVYSYDDVTRYLYNEFAIAESMGAFFVEMFRKPEWPAARHTERVKFVPVAVEGPDETADFDSLKVDRLTSSRPGGNQIFLVDYTYNGKGQIEVRAADFNEAADLVKEYFQAKHINVAVEGIFIPVR